MKTLVNLALFLFIISCQQAETLTEEEKIEITQAVRKTMDDYYRDVKQSGLTAEFKYLDNSADFFWVPPGYTAAISYDSVAAILKKNAPSFKSIENSFDTLKIIPLTRHLATYTGTLNSTVTDTAGQVSTAQLIETGILIKRKNGWKLLSGQTSMIAKHP